MKSEILMNLVLFGAVVLAFILFSNYIFAITDPASTTAPSAIAVPVEAIKPQISKPVLQAEATTVEPIVIVFQKSEEVKNITFGCKNLCGDNVCQEIVCLAEGCPCPETKESCPQDCSLVSPVAPVAPVIALPTGISVKVAPTETKPILVENRPIEFEGIEAIPAISTQVKPIPTQPSVSVKVSVDKEEKLTKIEVGDTVAVTKEILKFENVSLKVETPKGDISVQVLPNIATQVTISKEPQKIENIELKVVGEEPIYEIDGKKDARLLWIFPVSVPITTHVSVETGEIKKTEKPWWSFLAW